MSGPPILQVIKGGKSDDFRIGSVRLTCGDSETSPAFTVDVQVVEEDTWQVISADPTIREIDEHPIRLMTGLIDQKPLTIGDVVVKGKRWHVVVYDFDQEPICRREWVETALQQVLNTAENNKVSAIAIPLLGCAHDCLTWDQSLGLLIDLLQKTSTASLQRVWLTVDASHLDAVRGQFQAASDKSMNECHMPMQPDYSRIKIISIGSETGVTDYRQAMTIADQHAGEELGEYMLLSWYDRDRDFESPQHSSECHADSETPGYVDYGLNHGATLKVDFDGGRFVFFYLPLIS